MPSHLLNPAISARIKQISISVLGLDVIGRLHSFADLGQTPREQALSAWTNSNTGAAVPSTVRYDCNKHTSARELEVGTSVLMCNIVHDGPIGQRRRQTTILRSPTSFARRRSARLADLQANRSRNIACKRYACPFRVPAADLSYNYPRQGSSVADDVQQICRLS